MRHAIPTLLILLAAVLGGCSRSFPSTFPRGSAASLDAPAAPVATVGLALREEPPLPGEPTEGWEALEPSGATAPSAHGGHVHAH
ncbi:MAG: hypothetical protein M3Y87_28610 [Myxococcota bacterium]|nr:hypothetical protein [Myxococcota bacterium]